MGELLPLLIWTICFNLELLDLLVSTVSTWWCVFFFTCDPGISVDFGLKGLHTPKVFHRHFAPEKMRGLEADAFPNWELDKKYQGRSVELNPGGTEAAC